MPEAHPPETEGADKAGLCDGQDVASNPFTATQRAAPGERMVSTSPPMGQVLWGYLLLTYGILLLNTMGFLKHVEYTGPGLVLYSAAVWVTYSFLYLTPPLILVVGSFRVVNMNWLRRRLGLGDRAIRRIVFGMAILSCTVVQYMIFVDKTVFDVFGFHLNGFVWNLVFTRGGIESMGGGSATTSLAVLVAVGFLVVQGGAFVFVLKAGFFRQAAARLYRRRPIVIGACCLVIAALSAQLGYGISTFSSYGSTRAVACAFPGFIPTTFARLASSLGYHAQRTPTLNVRSETGGLRYPLHEIRRDPTVKPLNMVWLVSESLRADMLDPEIMPNTWKLSQRSSRFEHHYSGGNGTRMAMFSMFYGLYGPYWFPFLAERRGPVLVDTLIDLEYQMGLFTSAMFSYPEFDKTVFSRIPSDQLHEGGMKPAWRQDQRHIDALLRFIDQRDPSKPFMTFLFFESPHANYSFSKKAIIRQPYAESLNYVSMDLQRDIGLIKNRYINASHQVDLSIAQVLSYLKEHDLFDSTIVLITGDHGEEFMEKGRWGHNSAFTEEQTRVPFVLWVPGKPPRVVTRITSHLDIPATMMSLLGVLNPSQDYSLGYDLFGPQKREFTVISAWNQVAYVDSQFKATFPTSGFAMFRQSVTTDRDAPVADPNTFYQTRQENIVKVMRGLKVFQ